MHMLSTYVEFKIFHYKWKLSDQLVTLLFENFEDDRFGDTYMIMIGPYAYEL